MPNGPRRPGLFVLYHSGSTVNRRGWCTPPPLQTSGPNSLRWDLRPCANDDVHLVHGRTWGWITATATSSNGRSRAGANHRDVNEGAPDGASNRCVWEVIEKHKVSLFLYRSTANSCLHERAAAKVPDNYETWELGASWETVGEPIKPESPGSGIGR